MPVSLWDRIWCNSQLTIEAQPKMNSGGGEGVNVLVMLLQSTVDLRISHAYQNGPQMTLCQHMEGE